LVYKNEKLAKDSCREKNDCSLWVTYDGYKASIAMPGPYDDRGDECVQDVPPEITNEIAWLEILPEKPPDQSTLTSAWIANNPRGQEEIFYTESMGPKQCTVRCCNESFDVYYENAFRHFSSLMEANKFIESCQNMVDGVDAKLPIGSY
jgi:hypothetical protein